MGKNDVSYEDKWGRESDKERLGLYGRKGSPIPRSVEEVLSPATLYRLASKGPVGCPCDLCVAQRGDIEIITAITILGVYSNNAYLNGYSNAILDDGNRYDLLNMLPEPIPEPEPVPPPPTPIECTISFSDEEGFVLSGDKSC